MACLTGAGGDRARRLRREATEAERRLWSVLRDPRLARWKFRRQHPVPPYYLDFACLAARLAMEVDGGQHAERARDARRDAYLRERGWQILRFWNDEVLKNRERVLTVILMALEGREGLSPRPSRTLRTGKREGA